MGSIFKCEICGEKIALAKDTQCVSTLGLHLMEKHPTTEMTHFAKESLSQSCIEESKVQEKPKETSRLPCNCDGLARSTKSTCVFRATVETWRQAAVRVRCPKCNISGRPCIRRQRFRVAHSPLRALCLLICWPVCFLPFLLPEGNRIDLFCRNCGAFLGQYDKKCGEGGCTLCPLIESISVHDIPTFV